MFDVADCNENDNESDYEWEEKIIKGVDDHGTDISF
jgi:hypothetical protein